MGVIVRTSKAPRAGLTFDGAQQVPVGFRNTEVGLLPQEWSVRTLGDLGQSLIGLTYDPQDIDPSGVLVLRSSNIGNNSLQFGGDVHVNMDIPNRMTVRRDDLLICVRNGSRPLIGKCALIDERAVGMAFGAFMSIFRSADSRFVFHCFQSDIIKRQINEHLGATINQITNKSLNSFKIPYPERREREAITAALSDMDELLDALEALIAKKCAIRQATLQQLLSGKTRLPGYKSKWEVVHLGEVVSCQQGGTPPKNRAEYWSGDIPFVTGADLTTLDVGKGNARAFLTRAGLNSGATVICRPGTLLLATRTRVGLVGVVRETMGASQDNTLLTPSESVDASYLLWSLVVRAEDLQRASRGTTIQGVSRGEVESLAMDLPPLSEQQSIASVLSDMDNELSALEHRSDKIRAIKQGMIQELLTGRTRLI